MMMNGNYFQLTWDYICVNASHQCTIGGSLKVHGHKIKGGKEAIQQ
jgi:hypothetical protein